MMYTAVVPFVIQSNVTTRRTTARTRQDAGPTRYRLLQAVCYSCYKLCVSAPGGGRSRQAAARRRCGGRLGDAAAACPTLVRRPALVPSLPAAPDFLSGNRTPSLNLLVNLLLHILQENFQTPITRAVHPTMLYRSVLSFGSLLLAVSFHGTSALVQTRVPQDVVDLGTAGDFAILTKTGVTTTGTTSVNGDMGTSPIAATAITGFTLIMDSTNQYSESELVDGKVYAASYTSPTPSKMTTAISDMETAYKDAAGRENPDELNLGAGTIEGKTLEPGLYKWGSSVGFTSSLTFDGQCVTGSCLLGNDPVWILQMTGDLIVGAGAIVTLENGAKAENIFWQVAGSTTLYTTVQMEGTILCATNIVFQTGSSLNGKALAQTAVTLDAATIDDSMFPDPQVV
eukprot:scaffold84625_cov69-Phaeocystis_antarctica.AAC.4